MLIDGKKISTRFITYNEIQIKEGVTLITGKSGVGKSTLLKIFNNSIEYKGIVKYKNINIESVNYMHLRKKILLVGQQSFLYDMTIKENFEKFYELRGDRLISDLEIKKLLKKVSIELSLNKNCCELSGGEKQRVYIGLCMSFKCEVLMLDEPTSSLDKETAINVIENIVDYCKKAKTNLILISHDLETVGKFANNIVRL